MALYCGIDLHSNNCWVSIIDEDRKVVAERKTRNDLGEILGFLEPRRDELEGVVVESTFNWYWLVDGLADAGFRMHLANTWACKQYEGLKYSDDRHDARWLAHMLSLGILPEGFVCPREERAVRDLLRRRSFLVHKRTSFLLSMRGALECRTGNRVPVNDLKKLTVADIESNIDDPTSALGIACLLEPISSIDAMIKVLEKEAAKKARLRDQFKPLQTVWGIGKILGLTIMYEVGQIDRFPTVGDFASYCRCVKSDWFTNGKRKGSGNTKNGNPYLSWAVSEAAHFATCHHERAKKFFQRKQSKTNGIVAIRALAHKLARASYYVMRDRVEFDPDKLFA
jgi:transposase